jgi:hypothetical protein
MSDLEQFLRRASRGLGGRERQTVRRELESHIRHRANRYKVSGSSEVEAIKLAIADLGEPREISSGMKGVYIMPTTIRAGVLTAALATLVFMGAQLSTAQISSYPSPTCLKLNTGGYSVDFIQDAQEKTFALSCEPNFLWVAMNSLRPTLEPLGVTFSEPFALNNEFPPMNNETEPRYHKLQFPNGQPIQTVNNGGLMVFDFVDNLKNAGLPIRIEGWDNPKITVGKISFTLGSSEQPITGSSVYATLLYRDLLMYFPGLIGDPLVRDTAGSNLFSQLKNNLKSNMPHFVHTVQTKLKPGTVVAVLSKDTFWLEPKQIPVGEGYRFPKGIAKFARAYIAPVANDGTIAYDSGSRSLAAVKAGQIKPTVVNGHAMVAVMQFTGYLSQQAAFEPVAPETIKIESR